VVCVENAYDDSRWSMPRQVEQRDHSLTKTLTISSLRANLIIYCHFFCLHFSFLSLDAEFKDRVFLVCFFDGKHIEFVTAGDDPGVRERNIPEIVGLVDVEIPTATGVIKGQTPALQQANQLAITSTQGSAQSVLETGSSSSSLSHALDPQNSNTSPSPLGTAETTQQRLSADFAPSLLQAANSFTASHKNLIPCLGVPVFVFWPSYL
jgi:hypothetical protein